ncbi:hypothetical protein Avbf_13653 [Armadillidium vulgare]|nr:hypothetical protein Avbf_13653 [Armadillidium vulgare]
MSLGIWRIMDQGGAIRRMLDKGELLFAGVNTRLANRKSRVDASNGSVLIFSPSVVYASLDELAPPISKSTKAVAQPVGWCRFSLVTAVG